MTRESTNSDTEPRDSERPSRKAPVSEAPPEGGPEDTPWRRQGGARSGRFWKMLAASAVFHAFLTPGPALLGLVAMLPALDLGEQEDIVEIELTAIPVSPVAPEPTPPPEEEPVVPPESVPSAPPEPENEPDAPEPSPDPPPSETPPPETEQAEDAPPLPTEEFGDPVALAGSAGAIADSNANVRMYLFTEVVRKHPLGKQIGQLLRRTPQWSEFFGPSNIDPISDIDRVLIAGPQLRQSDNVVAVVKHSMGRPRIVAAFDGLVATKGEWIDRDALLAKAHADRADRLFSAPNDEVVIVAPLHLESQVRKLGKQASFPSSAEDVAVTAYIVTPANVAKGTGIQLPQTLKSIKWARLDLRPTSDGGAILKVLAQDENAESASENAKFIGDLIRAFTTKETSDMGLLGWGLKKVGVEKMQYIKSVDFHAEGDKVHGELVVTQAQLTMAAGFLDGYLPPPDGDDGPQEDRAERDSPSEEPVKSEQTAEPDPAPGVDPAALPEDQAPKSEPTPVQD